MTEYTPKKAKTNTKLMLAIVFALWALAVGTVGSLFISLNNNADLHVQKYQAEVTKAQ